jgi:hypothetical protein
LHRLSGTFVLAYHGCDRSVAESLIANTPFNLSTNDYDWLGAGAYFWEANPLRGLEFAHVLQRYRASKPELAQIKDPFVIGAVIDLGFCLDLTTSTGIQAVSSMHAEFLEVCRTANIPVPRNEGGGDLLFRKLDCAVINHLHEVREKAGLAAFDTVRGVFIEGERIYPESGFFQKTHIQISVRNLDCIKGVFHVPKAHLIP